MDIQGIKQLISFSKERELNQSYDVTSFLEEVKRTLGAIPDNTVLQFITTYGFSYFNEEMVVSPLEKQANSDELLYVSGILGFGILREVLRKSIKMYYCKEQISIKFFPLCEGASGDLIVYSLEEGSLGNIYYWSHDTPIGDDLVLVAKSLNDFISRIEPKKEDKEDKREVVSVTYSPRLLKLINEKKNKRRTATFGAIARKKLSTK